MAGAKTRIIDLKGKTLVPGLIEPHNHFILYGPMALIQVNLNSPPVGRIRSMKDLAGALRERSEISPKGIWVSGIGYDDTTIEEKRHPTRHDLDEISTEHPIFISHVSMHFVSLNSRALTLAGINRDTPQPAGGA